MKSTPYLLRTLSLSLFLSGALALASTVTGTVTNKTVNKPAAGDAVVLVDVQAGMGEVAHATTDARGRYTLNLPGNSSYLVRVTHQGSTYFIAAPQSGTNADLTVYDVAAKVQGVSIEADVMEMESDNGQLKVIERYFVHNTSSPPLTQWSARAFEVVLPAEAVVNDVIGQRPNGLPTSIKLDSAGAKGHYAFNFPIQPDSGDKNTLFQITYHVPYSSGKFTFKTQVSLPADNVAVLLPKSMTLAQGGGAAFKNVPEDANIQTFVAKNATPAQALEFTISGTGSMPREEQNAQTGGAPDAASAGNQPGGGIGPPVSGTNPISTKYTWWILAGLALAMAAAAAFLLRKPSGAQAAAAETGANASASYAGAVATQAVATPAGKSAALLNALKEEIFALESEKINGTLAPEEYAQVKAALEIVLKRALRRNS
jgi:hypothetical protein